MDATAPIGPGHNSQDADALPEMLNEAQYLAAVVDAWVTEVTEISSEEQAGLARDLLAKLTGREKQTEAARKAEKQPHLDAAKAVDARYEPVKTMLAACVAPIKGLLEGWLRQERERQALEAAMARLEAEQLAAKAEAARKAAEAQPQVAASVAAEEAEKLADAAALVARKAAEARPQVASASGGARKAGLRKTWYATLVSAPLACRRYGTHPDVIEVLERLASAEARAAKGKISIPGFEVLSRETVA